VEVISNLMLVHVPNEPGSSMALTVGPNPGRGAIRFSFAPEPGAPGRLELFDVSGRQVAMLSRWSIGSGPVTVTWDGRLADGTDARPGVYFARLSTPSRTRIIRVVRLR
jgi:hypothetical protein